jgi:Short C-terminal domain
MLLRPPVFRGAPFLGAAVIGGTAYAAHRARSVRSRAVAQPPAPAAGNADLVADLTKLKELLDAGALTPEEFEAAKRKLLAA